MPSQVLLFLGPPGAGKGTVSQQGIHRFGWNFVSTGDLCRKHVQERTVIGQQIDFAMKSGKLVPDEVVTSMVWQWLNELKSESKTAVLDGYPRTVAQASMLENIMQEMGSINCAVVRFLASDTCVIERLAGRYICKNNSCQAIYCFKEIENKGLRDKKCERCACFLMRRSDDTPEIIKDRLAIYRSTEEALINFYRHNGYKIHEINVEKSLEQVFDDFLNVMNVCSL